MKTLVVKKSCLTKFNPEEFKKKQIKLDAVVDYAAKIEDAELLENASREKVLEIAQFVGWWNENVTPLKGWTGKSQNTDLYSELKKDFGKWQVAVSRWRDKLADEEKFIDSIVPGALRKAGIEPADNHRTQGSGENEWDTPGQYIKAAREAAGLCRLIT